MARNDDGFYHTLRLSRRNPNHIIMHQILVDSDKSVYKSQNQFIADAVEFYINALEDDTITNSGKIKKQNMNEYITKNDLELIKESIKNEVVKEVQKEMISIMGNFAGNMVKGMPADNQANDISDEKELNANTTLLGLAEMWGE